MKVKRYRSLKASSTYKTLGSRALGSEATSLYLAGRAGPIGGRSSFHMPHDDRFCSLDSIECKKLCNMEEKQHHILT